MSTVGAVRGMDLDPAGDALASLSRISALVRISQGEPHRLLATADRYRRTWLSVGTALERAVDRGRISPGWCVWRAGKTSRSALSRWTMRQKIVVQ
jgi:hypothetical protein